MKEKLLGVFYKVLGKLAKIYINRNKPYVIGVTGSIGKTSSRMIISRLLGDYLEDKKVYTSPKNFNGELGFALSVLQIEDYTPSVKGLIAVLFVSIGRAFFGKIKEDVFFLEYGIDHPGEMDKLLQIVKPHIGIFTRIDKVHAAFFGSPDGIAEEKFKMLENSKEAVFLNVDDEYAKSGENRIEVDLFFYTLNENSFSEDKARISFSDYRMEEENSGIYTKFDMMLDGESYLSVKTNLIGKENAGYISVGFVILDILSYKFYKQSFLQQHKGEEKHMDFILQPGRFSVFKGIGGSVIVDSSYNASPYSVQKVLENTLSMQNNIYKGYRIISVLGDMRELGDFAEKEHKKLSNVLSQISDYVFLVGELMEKYLHPQLSKVGFSEDNFRSFSDPFQLGSFLKEFLENSDEKFIIVFKGSQNTIFLEEAVKYILGDESDKENLVRQSSGWLKKKGF